MHFRLSDDWNHRPGGLRKIEYFLFYLLDDPLSSVDAEVSSEIFQTCICGTLSNRIRLFITHQARFQGKTDLVLLMDNESKLTKGIYRELSELDEFCEISTTASFVFKVVHGYEMYQRIYKILASLSGLERPKQNYSLQYQEIFKETATEKKERHQGKDNVSFYIKFVQLNKILRNILGRTVI